MNSKLLGLGALVLAGLAGRPLAADEVPLTLSEALSFAAQRNPDLQAVRERAAAQASRADSARRLAWWPRLVLSSGWSLTDTPSMVFAEKLNAGQFREEDFAIDRLNSPEALSHFTTVLGAEVRLDVFGKMRSQSEGQGALARALDAAGREAEQEVRLRVVFVYRRAALARRAVAVTERALAGAKAREADAGERVAQGAALKADLLRVRARRRQREAELAERRGEERIMMATLARLLGAAPGTAYAPTEGPPVSAPLEAEVTEWTARALADRPMLASARERREAARWSDRAEGRSWLPDLAVWGQVQDDRNSLGGGTSGAVGAGLRWNLFDAPRTKRRAAVRAELRAAEQELRAAEDQVRLEVETAWRRAQAARERHAAAAGGTEEGREALRVVQERRQAGMATLTDELETEAASLGAELEELGAAAETALADAALARAAGGI